MLIFVNSVIVKYSFGVVQRGMRELSRWLELIDSKHFIQRSFFVFRGRSKELLEVLIANTFM